MSSGETWDSVTTSGPAAAPACTPGSPRTPTPFLRPGVGLLALSKQLLLFCFPGEKVLAGKRVAHGDEVKQERQQASKSTIRNCSEPWEGRPDRRSASNGESFTVTEVHTPQSRDTDFYK